MTYRRGVVHHIEPPRELPMLHTSALQGHELCSVYRAIIASTQDCTVSYLLVLKRNASPHACHLKGPQKAQRNKLKTNMYSCSSLLMAACNIILSLSLYLLLSSTHLSFLVSRTFSFPPLAFSFSSLLSHPSLLKSPQVGEQP